MENIRIVESQNGSYMIALYNPDETKRYGLTQSIIKRSCETNKASEFIEGVINGFLYPYFQDNTGEKYKHCLPIRLSFVEFDNNDKEAILAVMEFAKDQDTYSRRFDDDGHRAEYTALQHRCRIITQAYINEFIKEKQTDQCESTGVKDWCVFEVRTLSTALDICKYVPTKYCLDGDLIKHNGKYYVSFEILKDDIDTVYPNITAMERFGNVIGSIRHAYLTEHGTLLSDNLIELCKSDLVL